MVSYIVMQADYVRIVYVDEPGGIEEEKENMIPCDFRKAEELYTCTISKKLYTRIHSWNE